MLLDKIPFGSTMKRGLPFTMPQTPSIQP